MNFHQILAPTIKNWKMRLLRPPVIPFLYGLKRWTVIVSGNKYWLSGLPWNTDFTIKRVDCWEEFVTGKDHMTVMRNDGAWTIPSWTSLLTNTETIQQMLGRGIYNIQLSCGRFVNTIAMMLGSVIQGLNYSGGYCRTYLRIFFLQRK